MINVSRQFKNKLKQGANIVNYADITLSDGTVLNLEPKDFMIGGVHVEDATTDGSFGVGYAFGKTASFRIANHKDQFSEYDFLGATIFLYFACKLDDGTIEKVRKGKYYVILPETPGDVIEFDAVDSMYLFDREYDSSLVYPATLQSILLDACSRCGVSVGFSHFDNYSMTVYAKPTDCSYRNVISYVCQIAGYNARISNDDKLQLVWWDTFEPNFAHIYGGNFTRYDDHEYIIDGGNFTDYSTDLIYDGGEFNDDRDLTNISKCKSLTVSTDVIRITGVKINYDDDSVLVGEEGYIITIKDNPLVEGQLNVIAQNLFNKLSAIVFRIFEAVIPSNPLYEPFDSIVIFDRKENAYTTIINSVSYIVNGYTTISCKAESTVRNAKFYTSPAARAVVQARKETESLLTSYDLIVQNMNMLAANALGYFTTYETLSDGSRITYLHDKPNLEDSITIYKITIDGFFVSQDGGESYTSGFDSSGNAVVNILSAIGINFDWAHGGTLTLGGKDDINGSLQVLDKNGNIIGKIDNNGFLFQLSWNNITDTDNVATKDYLSENYDTSSEVTIKIGASADGLRSEISKIQIGGTNLIPDTTQDSVDLKGYPSTGYNDTLNYRTTVSADGTQYVLSFEAKSTTSGDKIVCYLYNPDSVTSWKNSQGQTGTNSNGAVTFTLSTFWTKYWVIYDQTPVNDKKSVLVGRQSAGQGSGTVSVRKVKFEEGNKPTDWSPAPNDTEKEITRLSTSISQNEQAIRLEAERASNAEDTMDAAIAVIAGNIELKVSKGDVSSQLSLEGGDVSIAGERLSVETDKLKISKDGTIVTRESKNADANATVLNTGGLNFGKVQSDGSVLPCARLYPIYWYYQDNVYNTASLAVELTSGTSSFTVVTDTDAGVSNSYYDIDTTTNKETNEIFTLFANHANSGTAVLHFYGNADLFGWQIVFSMHEVKVRGTLNADKDVNVTGDLTVSGSKSRVVQTEEYGSLKLNAFETPECFFSDIGSGTIEENGKVEIPIDPRFLATIDLEKPYQVFLTRTNALNTDYVEKKNRSFIVHGEAGATFDWMLTAKQIGYSDVRFGQSIGD